MSEIDPGNIDLSSIDVSAIDADTFDTDAVARLVAATPDDKLAEAMAGPLRDVIVPEVFQRMPERVNAATAGAAEAVINWRIKRDGGEPDRWVVRVDHGACTVAEGEDPSPRVSLQLDAVTFLKLVTGNLNPVTAFMAGQITIQGDLMFAATVSSLFEIPSAAGA